MSDDAESIVRDLADKEPRSMQYNGGNYFECSLCGANDMDQVLSFLNNTDPKDYDKRPRFVLPHKPSCPYQRALAYVTRPATRSR